MLNEVAFLFVKDVLDFWFSPYIFILALVNSENTKKTKRFNKHEIKKQLIESITINDAIEIEVLNELAGKVQKPEEGADVIKQYKELF